MTSGAAVRVEPTGSPAYEVRIGPGIAAAFADEIAGLPGIQKGRIFAVVDTGIPPAWVDAVLDACAAEGFDVTRFTIEPSEQIKSIETFRGVLCAMADAGMERREPVLALGGGIVGDIAGFAAASYRRGVPVIQCPTTLLAAVDASVGGKTGVNLSLPDGSLLKNMAGAFHQPAAVLADVSALVSLDERTFRAGLAECIKHGMIAADWSDAGLLDWTRDSMDRILARQPGVLVDLIARNVAIKARVVAADVREQSDTGGRALLNLGHTYAHAIETIDGLAPDGGPLLHGEAVALGLVAAAECSRSMGRLGASDVLAVRGIVEQCGLPSRISGLPDDGTLRDRMMHDKKTAGGRLRLTLFRGLGRAELVSDPPIEAVGAGWSAIRA